MLRQLRSEKVVKRIMIAVIVIVVPSFIVFYGWQSKSSSGGMGPGTVATIKFGTFAKTKIEQSEITQARQQLDGKIQMAAQESRVTVDSGVKDRVADSKRVVNEALDLALLKRFAEENGIVVSEQEVQQEFDKIPPAQRPMYLQYLAQRGQTLEQALVEEQYSRLLGKTRATLAARVRVPYYEAWLDFLSRNEKMEFEYVKFNVSDYMGKVEVKDSELSQYLEQNTEQFRIPDQIQYSYVKVTKDDLKSSVTVTEDEITSYYAANAEEFRLPRSVHARQIFLAKPSPRDLQTTSPEELTSKTEAVRARAQDIFGRIAKGEDFATLANQYNEETVSPPRVKDQGTSGSDSATTATDTESTAGGNLGFILETSAKGFYGDEWTSAVFAMSPGSVSPPIETRRGLHIVKLEAIREGVVQPLNEVRSIVRERIAEQKAQPLFEEAGEKLRAAAEKYTSLEKVAEVTSQTVQSTGKVDRGAKALPGIGPLAEFEEAVRDLEKGIPSQVLTDSSRHLLIQPVEEFPAHNPSLDEVREKVVDAYKRHKAREAARADAEKLKSKAVDFAAMQTAVKDMGATITKSRAVTRAEAASVLGPIPDFEESSQQLKQGDIELSPVGTAKEPIAFVLFHVASKTEPSNEEFAKELPRIMRELAEAKARLMIDEYLRDRRRELSGNIEISPEFR